jgi:hypothetical protein
MGATSEFAFRATNVHLATSASRGGRDDQLDARDHLLGNMALKEIEKVLARVLDGGAQIRTCVLQSRRQFEMARPIRCGMVIEPTRAAASAPPGSGSW